MGNIMNYSLRGKKLATSSGVIEFDEDGIALAPDDILDGLLELKGFTAPEDNIRQKSDEEDDDENKDAGDNDVGGNQENQEEDENDSETKFDLDELNNKGVPQLRKIAKENDIDLGNAKTKEEIIEIMMG